MVNAWWGVEYLLEKNAKKLITNDGRTPFFFAVFLAATKTGEAKKTYLRKAGLLVSQQEEPKVDESPYLKTWLQIRDKDGQKKYKSRLQKTIKLAMKYKPAITPLSPLPESLTNLKTKLVSLAKELGKMESGKQAKTASNQWKISQEGNKFYREQEGEKEELTVAKLNKIYKNTNYTFRLDSVTGPQGGWFIYRYDKTTPTGRTETVALSGGGVVTRPIYSASEKITKKMLQEMASSLPKYTYFIKAEGEDGKWNTVYRNNAKTGVEERISAQNLNTVWKNFIIKDKGIPSNQRNEYFKKHENLPDFKFAKSQWHKQPGPNDKLEPGSMTGPFPYVNTIKHKTTSVKRKEKPHPSGRPSRTDIEISFHPLGLEELNYEEKGTIVTEEFLNGRPELQADL